MSNVVDEKISFVVKISQWIYGQDDLSSGLKREIDDKMCCLGFLAKKLGHSDSEIINTGSPSGLESCLNHKSFFPDILFDNSNYLHDFCRQDSELSREIMTVNDDPTIRIGYKIIKLKELFAKANIEVNFVD